MIGIIGAMASEVDGLKANMQQTNNTVYGTTEFCSGILFGKEAVVAKCGVGKVNAALCTQNMVEHFSPELIINTGCAAGVGDGLHIGDIVLAEYAVQHDLDYGTLGDERGYIDGLGIVYIPADSEQTKAIAEIAERLGVHTRTGVVATGDQFLCDPVKKEDIKTCFHAQAVEMEGGAVAHAAAANNVPFVILRSVSDCGDDEAPQSFETFVEQVNKTNLQILKQFLEGEK